MVKTENLFILSLSTFFFYFENFFVPFICKITITAIPEYNCNFPYMSNK